MSEESNAAGQGNVVEERLVLPKSGYTSMEVILEYLFWMAGKLILVPDEYRYLRKSVTGLDSIPSHW